MRRQLFGMGLPVVYEVYELFRRGRHGLHDTRFCGDSRVQVDSVVFNACVRVFEPLLMSESVRMVPHCTGTRVAVHPPANMAACVDARSLDVPAGCMF